MTLNLPPAPEQDAAQGDPDRGWDPELPCAYDEYIKSLPDTATVFRVTPKTATEPSAFPVKTLTPGGTGVHEAAIVVF